jgi:hypothetical protein
MLGKQSFLNIRELSSHDPESASLQLIYGYQYPDSGNVNDTWTRNTIVSSGNAYEDMLAFDVNGDGAVDIVASFDATFSGTYNIVWFENPRGNGGNPATDPWVMHTVGSGQDEISVQIADIDEMARWT